MPLADQDRSRWDRAAITEGVALITAALRQGRMGEYQAQAAIAAVHDQAGERDAAIAEFRAAAARTTNLREREFLTLRAARLAGSG